MKRIKKTCIFLSLIALSFMYIACGKTHAFVGTYDGVTTTEGEISVYAQGYIDETQEITDSKQNVRFEISKGKEKNKIVLKQTQGDENSQFEAVGIVDGKEVTFLPFTMPIAYGEIKTDVQVIDMKAAVDDGELTYSYSYGHTQDLGFISFRIKMKAKGIAKKNK